jgi:hypothetical protein
MEAQVGREEILRRLQTAHNGFEATLARLTPKQMLEPGVVGRWSVKDVLAHLVFWNAYPLAEIEAALNDESFEHPEGTTDEINERVVAQHRTATLQAVREDYEATYSRLVEMVKHLPDEAFQAGSQMERILEDTIHGVLANNTYEHWPIHAAQIREWIERGN